jgi:hypothetical protein
VLRKRLSVLVGAAVMVLLMFAASAPVFAQDGCVEEFPGGGSGACEVNPGQTEGARSRHVTPPENKPGSVERDVIANEKNPETETGRGKRAESSVPTTTE